MEYQSEETKQKKASLNNKIGQLLNEMNKDNFEQKQREIAALKWKLQAIRRTPTHILEYAVKFVDTI